MCGGAIDYTLPPNDPRAFVIDEVLPVSRWREFGYPSPRAAAEDFNNLRAAHRICNARKSNKTIKELQHAPKAHKRPFIASDGEW